MSKLQVPPGQKPFVRTTIAATGRKKLVNNAGVFVSGAVNDPACNAAEFDCQFAINVDGVASAVRAAAPFLGDGGRIISIGSIAGANAPWPGIADYAASKAAVALYTLGWARDLGSRGIHDLFRLMANRLIEFTRLFALT